jgi:hypothetical protein
MTLFAVPCEGADVLALVLPRVPVYGLADSERYRVGSDGPVMSGKALKERGLDVELQGDFRSDLIRIERVD